jgi:hypothetical protein
MNCSNLTADIIPENAKTNSGLELSLLSAFLIYLFLYIFIFFHKKHPVAEPFSIKPLIHVSTHFICVFLHWLNTVNYHYFYRFLIDLPVLFDMRKGLGISFGFCDGKRVRS